MLVVLAVQPLLNRMNPDREFLRFGLVDWSGHLATGAVIIAVLRPSRRVTLGILAGSVLIDVDHLPHELGTEFLTAGTPRPYTHSLSTFVVVLAIAALARSKLLLGAAIGLLGHFWRDLGSGDVVLFWPLSKGTESVPFAVYVGTLALIAALAAARPRQRGTWQPRRWP